MFKISQTYRAKYLIIFLILATISFLTIGTGLHSDDYGTINTASLESFLTISPEHLGWVIVLLPTYLTYWWAYLFLGYENIWVYDLIKSLSHLGSIILSWYFFKAFLGKGRALLAAIFFVLFPLHDAANYWYMVTPYIFWPSVIMFSYYLFSINRYKSAFLIGLIGAFSGYFSPPYIFGLSIIFLIQRKYKNFLLFIAPGILYVIYYFYIKINFSNFEKRIDSSMTSIEYFSNITLQIFGTIDSFIGPSALIKVYYSIQSLSFIDLIFSLGILFLLFANLTLIVKYIKDDDCTNNCRNLLWGSAFVLILSLMMFALTGRYVPSPFNLGNRSLVYGSLLAAVILASIPVTRKTFLLIWLIFILPVFGISNHWKSWNQNQKQVIANISNNQSIKLINKNDLVVITGNIYSQLGPYSYIEFFGSPWVTSSIFNKFGGLNNVVALTSTLRISRNEIVETKFDFHYPADGKVFIYDSINNLLIASTMDDIQEQSNLQAKNIRHWVQLMDGIFIESLIIKLSPRLSYLFSK